MFTYSQRIWRLILKETDNLNKYNIIWIEGNLKNVFEQLEWLNLSEKRCTCSCEIKIDSDNQIIIIVINSVLIKY